MDKTQTLLVKAHFDASQALTQVRTLSKAMKNQTDTIVRQRTAARSFGTDWRNVGYQVQDVAVQLEMGTNPIRVMTQQLPQLTSAFGGLGIAVGAITAVALPVLAKWFTKNKDEAGLLEKAVESLREETDRLNQDAAVIAAGFSLDEIGLIRTKIEELKGTIAPLREELDAIDGTRFYETAEAMDAAQGRAAQLDAQLGPLEASLATLVARLEENAEAQVNVNRANDDTVSNAMIQAWRTYYATRIQGEKMMREGSATYGGGRGGDPRDFEDDTYWSDKYFPAPAQVSSTTKEVNKQLGTTTTKIEEGEEAQKTWYEQWGEDNQLLSGQLEGLVDSGIGGFVDEIAKAEQNWKEFAKSFLRNIAKMIAQQMILNIISGSLGGPASGATSGDVGNLIGAKFFAKGGVVNSPTVFPMSGGVGIAGEAGPEAIIPLTQRNGQLGVKGSPVNIVVQQMGGVDVDVRQSEDEIIIRAARKGAEIAQGEFNRAMATGQGAYARALEQGYHSRRRAT